MLKYVKKTFVTAKNMFMELKLFVKILLPLVVIDLFGFISSVKRFNLRSCAIQKKYWIDLPTIALSQWL